jgi:hypothetical protein
MVVARILPTLLVVAGVGLLAGIAASTSRNTSLPTLPTKQVRSLQATAEEIDAHLLSRWGERNLAPAVAADELTVLRRLSLALCGTVPSLEEIRRFEADAAPDRLERWTAAMLEDNRFINYFAERLARAFVGVEGGQFIIFRRDRYAEWLRQQLREHRPYDEMVADMLTGSGVWTGKGEVNFITAAYANDEFDRNKLTARTVRAFLGQRIDCAQCHDHPFDTWKQSQFEGLTAHFGQVGLTLVGVHDSHGHLFDLPGDLVEPLKSGTFSEPLRRVFREHDAKLRPVVSVEALTEGQLWLVHDAPQDRPDQLEPKYLVRRTPDGLQVSGAGGEYIVEDRESLESRIVDPAVPFHPEWAGTEGSRRERLARWVTHPENRRFDRAIANRVWGLMFGRPYLTDRPVDDLPSPEREEYAEDTRVLDLLGRDFRKHGCDLRRLIQVIAATQAFRLESRADVDESQIAPMEENWAVYPLVRLRPEQVIGSMLQASSVKTIDQNSHIFVRFLRLVREGDFVREYGDPGENELEDRAGTIPQALLRMNGELARELSSENPFTAPARIARFSATPEMVVENCFLACLTRRPTSAELKHFVQQLDGEGEQSEGAVEDLYWTLYNAPEFSWNH